jgi:hypothetical protein
LQAARHQARGFGHARAGAHQHVGLFGREHAHALLAHGAHAGPAGALRQALATLRSPIMMMSGLARTTNSGLILGKGPQVGRDDVLHAQARQVSPMNDVGPAA